MFIRAAILAGLAATLVATQDQPPPATFRTEANYVRVDAYITKNDAPVTDLTKDDFEVLEDRAPQRIEQFERVSIRPAGAQETRIEPNNVREMRSMLEGSRARVFVLFLDTNHVEVEGSHNIRQPLIDALDHMIGADDLVGVMTPEMSATDVTFARKTTTIEGFLSKSWNWGQREQLNSKDPVEDQYRACYPGTRPGCQGPGDAGIAAALIDRRREKRTLDALQDLVRFLRGVREERKAVLAISDGWRLFRPDESLMRPIGCSAPSGTDVQRNPRTGRLGTDANNAVGTNPGMCDRDRMNLAQIDDGREFQQILDEANRANASFYPIDPRGLVVFDTSIAPVNGSTFGSPAPMVPPSVDRAMLQARLTSLRTLAEATDGLAIVDSNNLAGGLKRVVDDLTSYYLLGYYSTGKLDGKFHAITVRVKRPGVQVRARRGYLAATTRAATTANAASATPAKADAEMAARAAALAPLDAYGREVPLRAQAAAGWKAGDPPQAFVAVDGELGATREFEDLWREGATVTVDLAPPDGPVVASTHVTIPPSGSRAFRVVLAPEQPLTAGEYVVRLGARSADAASMPTRETIHINVPPAPEASGAIWTRRGQTTGNRDTPTADVRFHHMDQARVAIPTVSTVAGTARLLDRAGHPLNVPVGAALESSSDGTRWLTARVSVAPLAIGDYVIELSDGNHRVLAAFRVVR